MHLNGVASEPGNGGPGAAAHWSGPAWEDPALLRLAAQLRKAHRLVAPLPAVPRRRLSRQLLAITDLAKRDSALAARRLDAFLEDLVELRKVAKRSQGVR